MHKILVDSNSSEYRAFDRYSVYLQRALTCANTTVQVDVSGPFWVFLFGVHPPEGTVTCRRHGDLLSFNGLIATFLPPFSIVTWHIQPCHFQFEAIISLAPLPGDFGSEPFSFSPDARTLPDSIDGLWALCRQAKSRTFIGTEEKMSSLARQAKEIIDQTYHDDSGMLADVVNRIGHPHATISRAFKKCYGLTPVQYRSKLRIADAQRHLLAHGSTAVNAAVAVGFEDLSQFNRQFRRQTKTTPAKFRPAQPLLK